MWFWKGKSRSLKVLLGPILFVLYINDLPENIHSEVRLFADYTAVYLTINSKADCQTLQQDLHKLEIWEKDWEIKFNPSKCQILHITQARTPIRHQYILHGQVPEAVDHAKYLGLEISHDLNWNTHIQNLTTKANRTMGFVRRNIPAKHQGIRQKQHTTHCVRSEFDQWYQWHTNVVRSFAIGSHWLQLVPMVCQWLPLAANGFYHS